MANGQALTLDADARLTLTTLGGASLACVRDGTPPTPLLGPGKPLALITYLAFLPRRTASREHLIGVLWADADPERAHHALRQTVWQIRHAVAEQALVTHNGELVIGVEIATDRDAFLAAVEAGDLERAVTLYAGEFLPDFATPGGADFEQWADLERIRLRTAFLRSAETLARRQLATGHVREAQRLARRARDADPLDENGWRLLLETLVAGNDWTAAAMEADALERVLGMEDREAEPATTAAIRRARQAPVETAPGTRPALVAELVGREKEFAAVLAAWDDAKRGTPRRVHVTAPAGLGKTRLLQDLRARLRAAGARAVQARANPGERRIPYAFAADLAAVLAGLPGAAGVSPGAAASLVALNPSLSSRFAAPPDRSLGDESLRRRGTALAELLHAVADEAPIALLLDDLHWADPESRHLVAALAARLEGHRALLVTTARPVSERIFEGDAPTLLGLQPLTTPQVAALVTSIAALPGESWADECPSRLGRAAVGSPLLVLESLQLALERDLLSVRDGTFVCPDPAALFAVLAAGGALRQRIEELDRTSRWLVLALAVAGTPLDTITLARASGRSPDAILPALAALEERGLVSRAGYAWEPGHDELASLAIDTATPEALRAARAELGRVFAAGVGSDAELARQATPLLAAAGDRATLSEVFRAWLAEARRRGDGRRAAAIAGELLGDERSAERVGQLVRSLPVATRFGFDLPGRRAAVGVPLLAMTMATVFWLARPTPPPPDAAVLLIGDQRASETKLRRETWERTGPLAASRAKLVVTSDWVDLHTLPVPAPTGGSWLAARVFSDSGGIDLVQLFADGRPARRLASAPGDDSEFSWAPDGSAIVISTARWNALSHYDLAVLDLERGTVRALTRSDARDQSPQWSPDGTRIAFVRLRYDERPREVCWITVAATAERCVAPAGLRATGAGAATVLGWRDERHFLVRLAADRSVWYEIDVTTSSATVVRTVPLDGREVLSPDGSWLVGRGTMPGGDRPEWLVLSVERPTQARPIGEDGAAHTAFWATSAASRPWLDTVGIVIPDRTIPVTAPHRLAVRGADQDGHPMAVHALSWHSSDPRIATVDSAGVVWPRRPGRVVIHASAGGWRGDSVTLEFGSPESEVVLRESWETGLSPTWVPFGEPRPEIVREGDVAALWNHGDSSFESGVYSRQGYSGVGGLGIEAPMSGRLTAVQWQTQVLMLDTRLDITRLAEWDHRTGAWPGIQAAGPNCVVSFPGDEGSRAMTQFAFQGGLASERDAAPADMSAGGWHTIRIQLLPDGRCGFAVDGVPVWLSPEPVALDLPFRIMLYGRSHGTRLLVGPVEVWTGVRDDIDWRTLK